MSSPDAPATAAAGEGAVGGAAATEVVADIMLVLEDIIQGDPDDM